MWTVPLPGARRGVHCPFGSHSAREWMVGCPAARAGRGNSDTRAEWTVLRSAVFTRSAFVLVPVTFTKWARRPARCRPLFSWYSSAPPAQTGSDIPAPASPVPTGTHGLQRPPVLRTRTVRSVSVFPVQRKPRRSKRLGALTVRAAVLAALATRAAVCGTVAEKSTDRGDHGTFDRAGAAAQTSVRRAGRVRARRNRRTRAATRHLRPGCGSGRAPAATLLRLGDDLGALQPVLLAEGAEDVEDLVVHRRAGGDVGPGQRGDLRLHVRVVLEDHDEVGVLVEERLELLHGLLGRPLLVLVLDPPVLEGVQPVADRRRPLARVVAVGRGRLVVLARDGRVLLELELGRVGNVAPVLVLLGIARERAAGGLRRRAEIGDLALRDLRVGAALLRLAA